jgi:hypothetical protein
MKPINQVIFMTVIAIVTGTVMSSCNQKQEAHADNQTVRMVTVNGVSCVLVDAYSGVAISCDWDHREAAPQPSNNDRKTGDDLGLGA